MTPKEKAQELVDKFSIAVGAFNKTSYRYEYEKAKLCALIAVDEAEKSEYNVLTKFGFVTENYTSEYWQQVKSEIEKL